MNHKHLIAAFSIFSFAYLLSSLLRGVTAALAPHFVNELQLEPTQLGLLAGAYFLGFGLMQLPLGLWLDRYGAKPLLVISSLFAVIGCYIFAKATQFETLLIGRLLSGIGVSASFIAPLTVARLYLSTGAQQSVNAWLLTSGSLGLLLATWPLEQASVWWGWRDIFQFIAICFIGISICLVLFVPHSKQPQPNTTNLSTYKPISNPYLIKLAPIAFISYASLVAIQTLWAGPWLSNVVGLASEEAALGLLGINLVMFVVFTVMGIFSPKLLQKRAQAEQLLLYTLPFSLLSLSLLIYLGQAATWIYFALYCLTNFPLALTHPLVGQHFAAHEAGRAIAFFNLLLFLGVFFLQWLIGKLIQYFSSAYGYNLEQSYQLSFLCILLLCTLSYGWLLSFDFLQKRAFTRDVE